MESSASSAASLARARFEQCRELRSPTIAATVAKRTNGPVSNYPVRNGQQIERPNDRRQRASRADAPGASRTSSLATITVVAVLCRCQLRLGPGRRHLATRPSGPAASPLRLANRPLASLITPSSVRPESLLVLRVLNGSCRNGRSRSAEHSSNRGQNRLPVRS